MISYLSSSFIYAKVANMLLWFYADVRLGLVFSVIFVCKYNKASCALRKKEVDFENENIF